MGCGPSRIGAGDDGSQSEMYNYSPYRPICHPLFKTMKAAILIQRWYRRYLARLEARRRYTWNIFQTLEYAGEQDQLRLYNFFNDMIAQLHKVRAQGQDTDQEMLTAVNGVTSPEHPRGSRLEQEEESLYEHTNPESVTVPDNYTGPTLRLPITSNQVESLIEAFKRKQVLHARYVLELLHEARTRLKEMPNIRRATTKGPGKQLTVVGDLHGKLDDLLTIFYKWKPWRSYYVPQNGLPDANNPYLINGDFVDRGPYSVEICIILFSFLLLNPGSFFINRGNHEDHVMNLRYGFVKEIMLKYKSEAKKVRYLFEDVFSWLPLATVIDKKILVTHGGISDITDLKFLEQINRHSYLSALKPPYIDDDEDNGIDNDEWKQILDLLWSDPKPQLGCQPNTFRNGGSFWGPDITKDILKKHKLDLLIRSHECKEEGYEYTHNNMVLTIFSASNYYELGSNKGAYIKLGPDLKPRVVQYIVTRESQRKLTAKQRVNLVEDSALRFLKAKIYANEMTLISECQKFDVNNTGLITVNNWITVMTKVLQMDMPWRSLKNKLVTSNDKGLIKYKSIFEEFQNKLKKDQPTITEALYKNKDNLETIFRAMDKDNSGFISMSEFEDACRLLSQHTKSPISKDDIKAMGRNIDMNKDGLIDFNEFLEAFRIVDQFGQELQARRASEDIL